MNKHELLAQTMCHTSPRGLQIGTKLKFDPKTNQNIKLPEVILKVEEYFDLIRQKNFPTRPSRLTSIFVAPISHLIQNQARFLYSVECSGKLFLTDRSHYQRALYDLVNQSGSVDSLNMNAHRYWSGKDIGDSPELLVNGEIIIKKRLFINLS